MTLKEELQYIINLCNASWSLPTKENNDIYKICEKKISSIKPDLLNMNYFHKRHKDCKIKDIKLSFNVLIVYIYNDSGFYWSRLNVNSLR